MRKLNKKLAKNLFLSLMLTGGCLHFHELAEAADITGDVNGVSHVFAGGQDIVASSVSKKYSDNSLALKNSSVNGSVYGANATSNIKVGNNTVDIVGGSVAGKIKGGYAGFAGGLTAKANATGNNLKVSGTNNTFGSNISAGLYAGYAGNEGLDFMSAAAQVAQSPLSVISLALKNTADSTAAQNTTSMTAGAITEDDAYGGYAKALLNAKANQNIVNIDSNDAINGAKTTVKAFVVGGYAAAGLSTEALENTIKAENAELVSVVGSLAVVGAGNVKTSSEVTINGGAFSRALGGYCRAYFSGNSEASDSKVYVKNAAIAHNMVGDADFADFFHGKIGVLGGFSQADKGNATADNNEVSAETIKATADSYQGKKGFDFIMGGVAINKGDNDKLQAVASQNEVTINDTQADLVAGGFAEGMGAEANGNVVTIKGNNTVLKDVYGGSADKGTAKDNTVNWCEGTINGFLYGGFATTSENNVLNVYGSNSKKTLNKISGFQEMNFYINKDVKAGTILVKVQDKLDLKDVKVNAGIEKGSKLVGGDRITLVEAAEITNFDTCTTGRLTESDYAAFDFDYEQIDNKLDIKLQKMETTDNTKSLVETQLAGISILNQGADLLANSAFQEANVALQADNNASFVPYASVGGNKLKIKTGSHVDVSGWNFHLGLAKNAETKHGSLLWAPIFEYGRGKYDSYLDNGYHGEGNSHYWGIGLMAKKSQKSGFYYEGSIRGGKLNNDYKAKENSYDTDSPYISAHAGFGKKLKLNEKDNIDFYGKYFYIHQSGTTADVSTGKLNYNLDLEDINSHRSRLGMHFTHAIDAANSYYAGLAWMHEFSGKARATLDGTGVAAPSLKGDSGVVELGWRFKPKAGRFNLAIDVAGYTGRQKGASVNMNFAWKF